jgi:hypothetical protein
MLLNLDPDIYMYCPLLLYDVVYGYCLNNNFGLIYYSSITTEIDENYLNQIYNLTNNSYNHMKIIAIQI